ncbi:MAG TPA: nuclear transport factor 2 family protein, partial [Streptomyces sp.]|nr:nuclear transport factor 2 family protein [Streptomyces sp.]
MTLAVTETQQVIVNALNGGNVAGVDEAFHPDSRIHVNGGPKRDLTFSEFKEMLAGLLAAFPDL